MDNPMSVDGIKFCPACERTRYSVEYADCEEFADGNLPVCIECYVARNGHGARIVSNMLKTRQCADCGKEKNVAEYSVVGRRAQNTLPHVSKKCKACSAWDRSI